MTIDDTRAALISMVRSWQDSGFLPGGPAARPLRVPEPGPPPPVAVSDGTETPTPSGVRWREAWPIHQAEDWAVYEVRPGTFEVHRNGREQGRPFRTSDRTLAEQVCDRWAREFGPGTRPDIRPSRSRRRDGSSPTSA